MPFNRLMIAAITATIITACGSPAPPEQPGTPDSYTDAKGVIVTKVRNAEEAAAAPIGRLIFIDPVSGEQRDPTAAELAAIEQVQRKAAAPGQRPRLQTFETKDGTVAAKLTREYMHELNVTADDGETDAGAEQ